MSEAHLTPMDLDGAELSVLPEARLRAMDEHVARCDRCAEARAEQRRSAARFRAEVFARTLPAVQAAAVRPWPFSLRGRWALAAPALALALGIVLFAALPRRPVDEPAIGIKGGAALRLFARRAAHSFAVREGQALAPGDAIRLAIDRPGRRHLLVASVDGAGKVSVYFPFAATGSGPVAAEGAFELPGSIVLDAAPGPERIFAFFSDGPLPLAAVRPALEALAARGPAALRATAQVPVAASHASFLFEKEAR